MALFFPRRYLFGGGGGDGLGFVIFTGLVCSPFLDSPYMLIKDFFVRFLPGYGFSSLAILYSPQGKNSAISNSGPDINSILSTLTEPNCPSRGSRLGGYYGLV